MLQHTDRKLVPFIARPAQAIDCLSVSPSETCVIPPKKRTPIVQFHSLRQDEYVSLDTDPQLLRVEAFAAVNV